MIDFPMEWGAEDTVIISKGQFFEKCSDTFSGMKIEYGDMTPLVVLMLADFSAKLTAKLFDDETESGESRLS